MLLTKDGQREVAFIWTEWGKTRSESVSQAHPGCSIALLGRVACLWCLELGKGSRALSSCPRASDHRHGQAWDYRDQVTQPGGQNWGLDPYAEFLGLCSFAIPISLFFCEEAQSCFFFFPPEETQRPAACHGTWVSWDLLFNSCSFSN